MDNQTIILIMVGVVVLGPIAWFFGGFAFKVLWGTWPGFVSIAIGAYMLWEYGMDLFVFLPGGILAGILFTWLWQRTPIFLKVDHAVGKYTFLD